MCEPTTAMAYAALAIGAAGTVMQYQESKNAAAAQEQMIEDGLAKDRAATARQYQEINESSQDAAAQRRTDYLIEAARIKAIGAESGLSGATQGRIEDEAENAAQQDLATLEANRKRQNQQAATQGLARSTQAGAQLSGIRRPSAMGAGLQIMGQGVAAYRMYDATGRSLGKTQTMGEINAARAANAKVKP